MKIFLNLLPPERKASIVKRFYWRYFLGQWFLVFLICIIALGTLMAISFRVALVEKQKENMMSLRTNEQQGMYQKYEKKFEESNASVKSANAFISLHTSFSSLLGQIENSLPDKVRLEKVSTQNFQVFLTGSAETRDALLLFQENIKQNSCFEAVNTPLSNLFSETNVQFAVDFIVKSECLRGVTPKL